MSIFRHLVVNVLLLMAAVGASFYIKPFSLHQVHWADYKQFDLPPDPDGIVRYSPTLEVDFRLPRLRLHPDIIREISQAAGLDGADLSDAEQVSRLTELVRSRLNGRQVDLPPADGVDLNLLYQHGTDYYALCSDYARLLNEVLQAMGLHSRVLWMEGHVAAEYFNRGLQKWVYLDPQINLMALGEEGTPLSVAQLIHAVEREEPFEWVRICRQPEEPEGSLVQSFDRVWYRNVLLNGECYVLSGETLDATGRWIQLLRYRSRPQIVYLETPYDTSIPRFDSSMRPQWVLLVLGVVIAAYYSGRYDLAARMRNRLPGAAPRQTDVSA